MASCDSLAEYKRDTGQPGNPALSNLDPSEAVIHQHWPQKIVQEARQTARKKIRNYFFALASLFRNQLRLRQCYESPMKQEPFCFVRVWAESEFLLIPG